MANFQHCGNNLGYSLIHILNVLSLSLSTNIKEMFKARITFMQFNSASKITRLLLLLLFCYICMLELLLYCTVTVYLQNGLKLKQ